MLLIASQSTSHPNPKYQRVPNFFPRNLAILQKIRFLLGTFERKKNGLSFRFVEPLFPLIPKMIRAWEDIFWRFFNFCFLWVENWHSKVVSDNFPDFLRIEFCFLWDQGLKFYIFSWIFNLLGWTFCIFFLGHNFSSRK